MVVLSKVFRPSPCGVVGSFYARRVYPFPHRRVAGAMLPFIQFKESFMKSLQRRPKVSHFVRMVPSNKLTPTPNNRRRRIT